LCRANQSTTNLRQLLSRVRHPVRRGQRLTARIIELLARGGPISPGAGVSNAYIGKPDYRLLSLSELVDHVRSSAMPWSCP
jgi:hypothetical protein